MKEYKKAVEHTVQPLLLYIKRKCLKKVDAYFDTSTFMFYYCRIKYPMISYQLLPFLLLQH